MHRLASVIVSLFAVSVSAQFVLAQVDESKLKPDSKGLEQRFKVMSIRFDAPKRTFVFNMEAKLNSDLACLYDAEFQDADGKRLFSRKLDFEDGGARTQKGDKDRAFLKLPLAKQMEKVMKIVIKKSD
jgi:hypothetical protein